MSDLNSMNRENKKRQLRQRVITTPMSSRPAEEDSEEIVKNAHKKRVRRRLRIALVVLAVLLAAGFGVYQYYRNYQYTDYEVSWEKEINEGSYVGYLSFGSNVIKYSKDGASYIDGQGKEVWAASYEMKSPQAVVNGNYAAVADQQGNSIYIFDKNGNTGVANTLLPIIKATVSNQGVVAAILEDSSANYMYFYKRDGSELDVQIKALLNGEIGYPIDISLSPDGTQLIGAYAYIKNGTLNGKVAFHNFAEIGKSVPNRFVGGFHDIYDSALVARVHFLDDTYACAFADNSISFFSTKNALSPALLKQVMVEEEIRSVFYSDQYVGVVVGSSEIGSPNRMDVYHPDGTLVFSEGFDYQYTGVDIDGSHVILYNENSCRVYNMSGKLKFTGEFDFAVSKIRNGRFPNTLIVTGPQNMKEIRLR